MVGVRRGWVWRADLRWTSVSIKSAGLADSLPDPRYRSSIETGWKRAAAVWPPYPEATDPRNRDLYARHGYQVREPFALPDGALFWPMWRPGTH